MIIGCIIIAPTSHHPLSLTLLRHHRHPRHLHLPARWHHRHPVHHHRLAHLSLSSRSRTHLSVHHRLAHLLLISLSHTHLSARLRERLLLRRRRRIARLPLRRPHVALPSHHRRALLVSPRKALALPRTLLHRLSHKLALLPPLRRLLPQEPALFLPPSLAHADCAAAAATTRARKPSRAVARASRAARPPGDAASASLRERGSINPPPNFCVNSSLKRRRSAVSCSRVSCLVEES